MAEIKIEKKSPVWPWVIGIIVLIAALIYFLGSGGDDDVPIVEETETIDTANQNTGQPVNDAVAEYIQFIDADGTMGLNHEYTSNALSKLQSAIQSKAGQAGVDISADMSKVAEHADHITNDPFETSHANSIRSAAEILTNAMHTIQAAKYPDLASKVDGVKNAAEKIDPSMLTLNQKVAVKSFFEKSADLLQEMN